MSAVIEVPRATSPSALDGAVERLRERAPSWAALPVSGKIALARELLAGVRRTAERSVRAACAAKGIPDGSPLEGEEWLSGPYLVARFLRQLIRSLTLLERNGSIPIGRVGETADGRLIARVFPAVPADRLFFPGVRADVHFEAGVDEAELHASRGRFHKAPGHAGKVCLVLGAGNINAIAPTDVITKMFNEGKVCVLKMNPVNAYLGPFLEEAFAGAVARGFLAVVYGGAEEGAALARHPAVDEIHVTGSLATHDAIVWGPPGPEREARKARHEPTTTKIVTSELGNISPVIVVPGAWSDRALRFQAESVAGAVTHNASFNCIAAKMLVLPRGWRERDRFLALVETYMGRVPARRAWYPGAAERYRQLTEGRDAVRRVGGGEGALPWTIVTGVDPEDASDRLFTTEPFCSMISAVEVGSEDPLEFLEAAVELANRRLWGTLAAMVLVPPGTLGDSALRSALDRGVRALRYGTVAVNVWSGYAFGFGTTPWGAYPGAPLEDVQSGRGLVHNTLMLEHVEKCVLSHPVTTFPKPLYFPTHRTAAVVGRRITAFEAGGSWARVPGVIAAALRA